MKTLTSFFSKNKWFWLIFSFFLFLRLFPYLNNNIPLGYDSGLYFSMFTGYSHVPWLNFFSLPSWISGNEPGIFFFQRLLTLSNPLWAEGSLIPIIIGASALLFLSVYLMAKKMWGKGTALWTVFLFSVSALQYRTYWYYYLKNIAALSFLSLTTYFLFSASYFAIPFTILTFYFHRPASVFLMIILLTGLIFEKNKRKFYLIVTLVSLLIVAPYYLLTFTSTVLPLIKPILKITGNTDSGTFYEALVALGLSLIYLPFSIWGVLKQGKIKKIVFAPFILSLIIVIFKLFFNRRIIIFADFFLLFFAGWSANQFFSLRTRLRQLLKIIYILLCVIFISIFVWKTAKPLIFPDEFSEIKLLNETEPDALVLVTDQTYTPWAYGWSGRRVIAPGFGENDVYWTQEEWNVFWMSGDIEKEKVLLLKLPQPLYIYHGDKGSQINLKLEGECFQKINWRTYKFICTN